MNKEPPYKDCETCSRWNGETCEHYYRTPKAGAGPCPEKIAAAGKGEKCCWYCGRKTSAWHQCSPRDLKDRVEYLTALLEKIVKTAERIPSEEYRVTERIEFP